jgi:hypothetical protein
VSAPDLAAELAELRHRLDVLESQEAIRQLRNSFHDRVNTNRWTEIGALFTADAELDYSYLGTASGQAEIAEFFGAMPRLLPVGDAEPFVRQFIHGHSVEIDGDTATGTSYLFATPVYQGQSFLLSGRFTDTYVRGDGQWLFASVALEVYYSVPLAEGWAGADRHRMAL